MMNFPQPSRAKSLFTRRLRAFTLIEIMIVVSIMGIILLMGVPSFTRMYHKEGMRKAVSDMLEACKEARGQAILKGDTAELVIHPLDATFEVPGGGFPLTKLPDNVAIQFMGVNFIELQEADLAIARFFPNGTSDEFVVLLRDDAGAMRKITLEVVTGIADVEDPL